MAATLPTESARVSRSGQAWESAAVCRVGALAATGRDRVVADAFVPLAVGVDRDTAIAWAKAVAADMDMAAAWVKAMGVDMGMATAWAKAMAAASTLKPQEPRQGAAPARRPKRGASRVPTILS